MKKMKKTASKLLTGFAASIITTNLLYADFNTMINYDIVPSEYMEDSDAMIPSIYAMDSDAMILDPSDPFGVAAREYETSKNPSIDYISNGEMLLQNATAMSPGYAESFIRSNKDTIVIGEYTFKKEYIEKTIEIGDTILTVYDIVIVLFAIGSIIVGGGVIAGLITTVFLVGKWAMRNKKLVLETVEKGFDDGLKFAKRVFDKDTGYSNLKNVKKSPDLKQGKGPKKPQSLKQGKGPNDLMESLNSSELPKARRNRNLANKKHDTTGIKFSKKSYPKFKSHYDCKMGYTNSVAKKMVSSMAEIDIRSEHDKLCYNQLFKFAKNNNSVGRKLGLDQKSVLDLKRGKIPRDKNGERKFTFHHNESNPNKMELVDFKIHRSTGHDGGIANAWTKNSTYWKNRL